MSDTVESVPQPGGNLPSIPDIEVQGVIGRGGMGTVYLGLQRFLKRKVAVKLLTDPGRVAGNTQASARFQREARTLAALTHPGIVTCHGGGTLPSGECYLVMEYVEGPDLKRRIAEHGPLSENLALRVLRVLTEALRYAHLQQIIHRDIKPENVLLSPDPDAVEGEEFPFQVKLADLGLARSISADDVEAQVTLEGQVFGTPAVMAPEQCEDSGSVDHRADIYALGCLLHHMLTGVPAFTGRSCQEILAKKLTADPPDPGKLQREVGAGVTSLARDLMAARAEDRPQTYDDLLSRIDRLLEQPRPAPGPPRAPPGRKRSWPWLQVAVVLIGMGAAAAYLLWPRALDVAVSPASPVEGGLITLTVRQRNGERDVIWSQEAGHGDAREPRVELPEPRGPSQVFTAPAARQDYDLHFAARREGWPRAKARLAIHVDADDDPPVVSVRAPRVAVEGEVVRAEAVVEDEDTPASDLGCTWEQPATPGSPAVELNPTGRAVRCTLPKAPGNRPADLVLQTTVSDGPSSVSAQATITVLPGGWLPELTPDTELLLVDPESPSARECLARWGKIRGNGVASKSRASPYLLFHDPRGSSAYPYYLPRGAFRLAGSIGPLVTGMGSRRKVVEEVAVRVELGAPESVALVLVRSPEGFRAEARLERSSPEAAAGHRPVLTIGDLLTGDWAHDLSAHAGDGAPDTHVGFAVVWDGKTLSVRWGPEGEETGAWSHAEHVPAGAPVILWIAVDRGSACFGDFRLEGLAAG